MGKARVGGAGVRGVGVGGAGVGSINGAGTGSPYRSRCWLGRFESSCRHNVFINLRGWLYRSAGLQENNEPFEPTPKTQIDMVLVVRVVKTVAVAARVRLLHACSFIPAYRLVWVINQYWRVWSLFRREHDVYAGFPHATSSLVPLVRSTFFAHT